MTHGCTCIQHSKSFHKRPAQKAPRKMSSAMETDANRGRTRGRGEDDDDQDGVPEHLKCVVCLGEGKDACPSRARDPTRI